MNKDYYIDDNPNLDITSFLDLLKKQNIKYRTNRGSFVPIESVIENVREKFVRCFSFSESVCLAKIEEELIFYREAGAKTVKDIKDIYTSYVCPDPKDMDSDSEPLNNFLQTFKVNKGGCCD